MGAGYHWSFFAAINPAAHLFGAAFVLQGLVFLGLAASRSRPAFAFRGGVRGRAAVALIGYGVLIYPLVSLLGPHPYPESPLFGVAPCPTTIYTIGMLLLAVPAPPTTVGLIPIAWGFVGGSAAILLDVPQDYGLLIAAAVGLTFFARDRIIRAG